MARGEAKSVGEWIHEYREVRGWSMRELAERSGISHNQVRLIEAGRSSPSLETLKGIAGALGVPVGDLIQGPDDVRFVLRPLLDAETKALLDHWRKLSEEDQKMVMEMVTAVRRRATREARRSRRVSATPETPAGEAPVARRPRQRAGG